MGGPSTRSAAPARRRGRQAGASGGRGLRRRRGVRRGEFADQSQHLLDLDEVEVRGGLVGQEQRRIQGERPGDRDALLLPPLRSPGRCCIRSGRPTSSSSSSARGEHSRPFMPAASSGTMTFSIAVRLASRLKAWNTMPTVRLPVHRQPRASSAVTSTSPNAMRPEVGREFRRGTTAAWSSRSRSVRGAAPASRHSPRGEAVDRPDRVAAARVLDDQILDIQVSGPHGPPNARAGSIVTARRSPAKLAGDRSRIATRGRGKNCRCRGPRRASERGAPSRDDSSPAEHRGDGRETMMACRQRPASTERVPTPTALKTAKSRVTLQGGKVDHRADDRVRRRPTAARRGR